VRTERASKFSKGEKRENTSRWEKRGRGRSSLQIEGKSMRRGGNGFGEKRNTKEKNQSRGPAEQKK